MVINWIPTKVKDLFSSVYNYTRLAFYVLGATHLMSYNLQDKSILFSRNEGYLSIVINNPKKCNCINLDMFHEIKRIFEEAKVIPTKLITITGSVKRSFSSGGDVVSLSQLPPREVPSLFKSELGLVRLMKDVGEKAPIVSIWHGITMGSGVGLGIHSSYRVAVIKSGEDKEGKDTLWAMPECRIGFFVDWGLVHYLVNLEDNIGILIGITGISIGPSDLVKFRFVDGAIESTHITEFQNDLQICSTYSTQHRVRACIERCINKFKISDNYLRSPCIITDEIVEMMKGFKNDWNVQSLIDYLDNYEKNKQLGEMYSTMIKENCPKSCAIFMKHAEIASRSSLLHTLNIESRIIKDISNDNLRRGVMQRLILKKKGIIAWEPSKLDEVVLSDWEKAANNSANLRGDLLKDVQDIHKKFPRPK